MPTRPKTLKPPKTPKIKYVLGGRVFGSQTAAEGHAKEILNRVPLGEPLEGADAQFVRDVFFLHEERAEKLGGHEPAYFFVRQHPKWPNRNFMVRRTDGEAVHFSYPHAIRPMPRRHWFGVAARNIVDPQKWAYRDDYFAAHGGPDGRAACELTGERVTPRECDVHHAGGMPFREIVRTFLDQRGLDPEALDYVGTTDGAPVLVLADAALAEDFARYHQERVTFQVVSTRAHRRLPRR